jgi:hypothetical protein
MRTMIKLTALGGALWMTAATAQTPAPVVAATTTGPIPVTAESGEPFRDRTEAPAAGPGLTPPVLIPYGYVDEEYFVSGAVDGKPYTTQLLVRKPQDPAKFSGVVVVETLHAQGGLPFWSVLKDGVMSGGHGWVMIVSQREPLEMYVRKFNAARYASLQIPQTAGGPGTVMAPGPQYSYSQQIMTQVGALLKSNAEHGPFAGMTVKKLVMVGVSQTGMHTWLYIQQSHAKARMLDGKPIYDGYFPSEALPSTPTSGGDAAIVHVVGEGDFDLFRALGLSRGNTFVTRSDSDAPNDRFREYQFPASSHVPTRGLTDPKLVFGPTGGLREGEHLSQFPLAAYYKAAFLHLVDWVVKGTSPPKAQPIEMADGQIVRDKFGNAKGGIRTPYVDLPTAHYIGSAPSVAGENSVRRMIGLEEPFPPEQLRSLYKSRAAYLKRFNREIDRNVAGGWLLRKDAEVLKADEAKMADF